MKRDDNPTKSTLNYITLINLKSQPQIILGWRCKPRDVLHILSTGNNLAKHVNTGIILLTLMGLFTKVRHICFVGSGPNISKGISQNQYYEERLVTQLEPIRNGGQCCTVVTFSPVLVGKKWIVTQWVLYFEEWACTFALLDFCALCPNKHAQL